MCLALRPWNEDPTCVHFTSVSELGTQKKKSMDQGTSGLARQRLMAKRGSWDFYSHHLAFSVQDHRLVPYLVPLVQPLGQCINWDLTRTIGTPSGVYKREK